LTHRENPGPSLCFHKRNSRRCIEAHLEMHVGSVDEREDEQGLAHLVEHVTFLGSKKRDAWLGSGTRGNAYTDFHHTVFHVHSPTYNKDTTYMLPNVLDILYDVAFNPQLLDTRVAKVGGLCTRRNAAGGRVQQHVDALLLFCEERELEVVVTHSAWKCRLVWRLNP
jgi:hypothetical protein